MRIVVPEFDASILNALIFFPTPVIVKLFLFSSIFAPKLLHTSIVAIVSLEISTFLIVLLPSARDAKNIALKQRVSFGDWRRGSPLEGFSLVQPNSFSH